MTASIDERTQLRYAIERLQAHPDVLATDLCAPDIEPTNTWTLECVCEGVTVLPAVLREIGRAGLHLLADQTGTRGEPAHTVVVARA
jgi:hypothetical protein